MWFDDFELRASFDDDIFENRSTSDWGGPVVRDILQHHLFDPLVSTGKIPPPQTIRDLCSYRAVCKSWHRMIPTLPYAQFRVSTKDFSRYESLVSVLSLTQHARGTFTDYSDRSSPTFTDVVRSNTTLVSLSIIDPSSNSDVLIALLEGLRENSTLSKLGISKNMWSEHLATAMGETFLLNRTLRKLVLAESDLATGALHSVAESINLSLHLKVLVVEKMELSDEEVGVICRALAVNASIEKFVLRETETQECGVSMAYMLEKNKNLKFLDLSRNFLSFASLDRIFGALKDSKSSLARLRIQGNKWILTQLPDQVSLALKSNSTLRELDLRSTLCFKRVVISFVEALEANTALQFVDIRKNDAPERIFAKIEKIVAGHPTGLRILYK
jgi:hypothetical protein